MATQPHTQPERIPPQSIEVAAFEPRSSVDLLTIALQNNAAIDVIERLATLHRDERAHLARVAFDDALSRCQDRLQQISADAHNAHTNSRYASYAKLDKVVRPIYTSEGFALSFSEKDCPTAGKTRFVAYLTRSGVTREYIKDLFPSTKGPQGKDVMTPIHADASADSYAKRYLLKDIFNIAIGEDDNDGNGTAVPARARVESPLVTDWCSKIAAAANFDQVTQIFRAAYSQASAANDQNAQAAYIAAKDRRRGELRRGNSGH